MKDKSSKVKLFYILIVVIGGVMSSCKTSTIISYENTICDNFLQKGILPNEQNYRNGYIFSRLFTTDNDLPISSIILVFRVFNTENEFLELSIKNLCIYSDKTKLLINEKELLLKSHGSLTIDNDFYQDGYSYYIDMNKINLEVLKNINYLLLTYEIDGKQYEEKLIRVEQKLPWIMKF